MDTLDVIFPAHEGAFDRRYAHFVEQVPNLHLPVRTFARSVGDGAFSFPPDDSGESPYDGMLQVEPVQ